MISGRGNKIEKKKKAEDRKKLSKSQRRQLKKEKDLQIELKELAATEDIDEKTKINTEIVQQIFWIYFRILKHKVSNYYFLFQGYFLLKVIIFLK